LTLLSPGKYCTLVAPLATAFVISLKLSPSVEPSVSRNLRCYSSLPSITFNIAKMTSQRQAAATVILRGSDDWFEWINQIANHARQLNLWQYVDPDAANRPSLPTEPEMPMAPAPQQAQGGPGQADPAPTPVTEEQLKAFDRELAIFRIHLSQWQTFSRNQALLDEFVVGSMTATYANYVSGETTHS